MRNTSRDRARLVAVVITAFDATFVALCLLFRTSEPVAVVFAVLNLLLAGSVIVLLRRPRGGRRDSDSSGQVF